MYMYMHVMPVYVYVWHCLLALVHRVSSQSLWMDRLWLVEHTPVHCTLSGSEGLTGVVWQGEGLAVRLFVG